MFKPTTFVALVTVASVAPAFGAPLDMYEFDARENTNLNQVPTHSESGALNFGNIIKGAAKLFFRDEDGLMSRDFEDLEGRDDDLMTRKIHLSQIQKGVDIGNGVIQAGQGLKQVITGHQRRELEDLIARVDEIQAQNGQASGALNFGNIIKGAAKLFFRENDELMARELEDLEARDDDLMSRKVHLSQIQKGVDIGNGVVQAAQGLKQVITGHQRRELEDLITRVDEAQAQNGQASGALNFGNILKGAAKIFFREEDELMARELEDLEARKIHLSTIQKGVDIGNGAIQAAQGLKQVITGHQRRELEDLIARVDEAQAQNGQASGALNFGSILKGAAKIFLRDEDELMARSPFISPFINRLPISNRRPIVNKLPTRLAYREPFHLTPITRPPTWIARSLNELD